jgi:hypothetical protein
MKTVKYLDINAEDRIYVHQQIAKLDSDFKDADDVEGAIIGGLKPDEHYTFTEDEDGRLFVSLKN